MIEFDGITAYLADSRRPGPGVVVLQEWWGLVPHILDVADRFAAAGFTALAPDLYRGAAAGSHEPEVAEKLMMELNPDRAIREVGATPRAAQSTRPKIGRPRSGNSGSQ